MGAQVLNKLPSLYETKGSLPCAQQPATLLYSQPDELNPYSHHSVVCLTTCPQPL